MKTEQTKNMRIFKISGNQKNIKKKEFKGRMAKTKITKRDLTIPSVGLIASGKFSHGSVQEGQGCEAKTASMPFSWRMNTQTHTLP